MSIARDLRDKQSKLEEELENLFVDDIYKRCETEVLSLIKNRPTSVNNNGSINIGLGVIRPPRITSLNKIIDKLYEKFIYSDLRFRIFRGEYGGFYFQISCK